MNKPTIFDKIQKMRNGEKIKCNCCEQGYVSAVGEPKTTTVFRCDSCRKSTVMTIR